MRKILLMIISGVSFCTIPVHAQFCTIATTPQRYKVEALYEDMKKPEPMPGSTVPVQEMASEVLGWLKLPMSARRYGSTAISACLIRCVASESLPLMAIVKTRLPERGSFTEALTSMPEAKRYWLCWTVWS